MIKRVAALAALVGGTAVLANAFSSDTIRGPAYVVDGDTIGIGDTRIRLLDIDAPERRQPCLDPSGVRFDCGKEAARQLQNLLSGHEVVCAVSGKDFYKRALARCTVGPTDVGQWMVARGYAVAVEETYKDAEQSAAKSRKGLWGGVFTDPWEERQRRRVSTR